MFVHGVAMVIIRDHQASNVFQFREQRLHQAGVVHGAQRQGGMRQRKNLAQNRPQGLFDGAEARERFAVEASVRRASLSMLRTFRKYSRMNCEGEGKGGMECVAMSSCASKLSRF